MKKNKDFLWVMLGPYINSKGTRGTNISANADLITVETLFSIYGLNVLFCGYLRGPGGFNYLTLPILLYAIYGPQCEKKKHFGIFGAGGGGWRL